MTQPRQGHRICIGEQPAYVRAGELQYFRVRPDLWAPALERMRRANFNAVSTYVPWILHEPVEGEFDFGGKTAPWTDLTGFLEACRTAQLPVMIRPGPQIYAELDGFGLPRWLGHTYPECVMRGPHDNLIKGSFYYYYSLLHPTYLQKVERWLQTVTQVLWPSFSDVILTFQLDNETGMPLGNSLGNFDFNPDTVRRYQHFLQSRYADPAKLSRVWGRSYRAFENIRPPVRPTGIAEATDWYDFFEQFVATYLQTLKDMALAAGVPVPLVINDLDIYLSPVAPGKKRGIAQIQGYDIYTKASDKSTTADFPFAPAHDPERFQAMIGRDTSLFAVEMGTGWFDPRAVVKPEATVQATMGGIAHGLQGHSYYIAHDGQDPSGAPYTFRSFFDAQGKPLERLDAVARVHEFIATHETALLASTADYASILYLTYQPYSRLMPGDYLPGQLLPDPLLYLETLGHSGLYDLLLTAGFLPRYADLQQVSDAELATTKVVCFPTKGWVDAESYAKLLRYVENGGQLITFPTILTRDAYGHALPDAHKLYPLPIAEQQHIGYGSVFRRLAIDLLGKYLLWDRSRLRRREPTAMQNTDSFEGLKVLLNQKLPSVQVQASHATIRGDYIKTSFRTSADAESAVREELFVRGACVGYMAAFGAGGSSTVIGTIPAGAYSTAAYYQLSTSERATLRDYAKSLMTTRGVCPQWSSDLDVECVLRRTTERSALLFIMNRVAEQRGHLTLSTPGESWHQLDTLWTYRGSSAILSSENVIQVHLQPDDVLVVRVSGGATVSPGR